MIVQKILPSKRTHLQLWHSLMHLRLRLDRRHSHLLQCARQRRIKKEQKHMDTAFAEIPTCLWNDCYHRFNGRTCGSYSLHINEHLLQTEAHQCLWKACLKRFANYEDLATHMVGEHGVYSEWTICTKMHYCYEHNVWCHSNRAWNTHLERIHLKTLNEYCGMIRECGVVVLAAHCLFCLGLNKPLPVRFTQFHDVFVLHKHMKEHLNETGIPSVCPHPLCEDVLSSEADFWNHALSIHGIPPFGPRRVTKKRKTSSLNNDGPDAT
jgi:hypothetical protein